jgi:prepilin-type N-terminal cleavage/methylation domain-containing protein
MSRRRGFSMVEVLVGLLVLTIVITTTIVMFTERNKRLKQANETILAYQALANEAEIWRRKSFTQLNSQTGFESPIAILAPLSPFDTSVKVDVARADVKHVTLTVSWDGGKKSAKLALVRVDTGGGNLW